MTGLLLWKEHLKGFYQKYNQLLHPLIRFLFTLCTVLSINSTVGYMAKLKNPLVVFGLPGRNAASQLYAGISHRGIFGSSSVCGVCRNGADRGSCDDDNRHPLLWL